MVAIATSFDIVVALLNLSPNYSTCQLSPVTPGRLLFLAYLSSVQIEKVLCFFAEPGGEGPVFGVMIGVNDGEDETPRIGGVGSCIGHVEKVEGDGFAVRRSSGGHARLSAVNAVVSEEQAVGAAEVNHADHIEHAPAAALFLDFAH